MSSKAEIAAATASRTKPHGLSRVMPLVATAATLAYSALLIATPTSRADETVLTAGAATSCPDVQAVFARGAGEPPGAGRVGDAFADSLRSLETGKSVALYGVQYPASHDFLRDIDGVNDASAFIENTAQACPQTKLVLGGYSQGAAVVDVLAATGRPILGFTSPLPDTIADHIAAVVVFGNPSNRIGEPLTALSPLYGSKGTAMKRLPDSESRPSGLPHDARPSVSDSGQVGFVDVHAHFVTDWYAAQASAAGHQLPDGMPTWPTWSAETHLELMDRSGIDAAVLSVSSPGVHFGDDSAARVLARRLNDFAASVVADHPSRFGWFASLPLPDVYGALAEIDYVFDALGADGIILETTSTARTSATHTWSQSSPHSTIALPSSSSIPRHRCAGSTARSDDPAQ